MILLAMDEKQCIAHESGLLPVYRTNFKADLRSANREFRGKSSAEIPNVTTDLDSAHRQAKSYPKMQRATVT